MSEQVFCKDCKHAKWRPWYLFSWRCHKQFIQQEVRIDPVTGPSKRGGHYSSCIDMRGEGDGKCGPDGKFWYPKHKRDLFKLIKHVSV